MYGKEGTFMNSASMGTLERIRRMQGADACRNYFRRTAEKRKENALFLLNGAGLGFPTLFVLREEIERTELNARLSARNRTALSLCGKILKNRESETGGGIRYQDRAVRQAFLWMFRTGASGDGLSDEFDQVLDLCASVLARRYHETSILPALESLIFLRNRKKGFLHDLIWAFFQFREPGSLRLIARHLTSSDERDAELACMLLHLPYQQRTTQEKQAQYREYRNWLNENSAFLTFTGESLLCSNQPEICSVNLGSKYLGKRTDPGKRGHADGLTPKEQEYLSYFAQAEKQDQPVLASYSRKLHDRSPSDWSRWIGRPVAEQVLAAKQGAGRRLI